jgi:nucleoside-diphosphate-sugar epimerase
MANILVTGGSGRVGLHVVRELAEAGHNVRIFDSKWPEIDLGVPVTVGDVEDLGQIAGAARLTEANVIIHLAAVPIAGIVTDDVLYRVNTLGTFNVFEAARLVGTQRVVYCSSDSVYGWPVASPDLLPEYLPIDEDHPVHPEQTWPLSKLVGEQIASAFAERGAVEAVVLRPPRILDESLREALATRGGAVTRAQFEPFGWIASEDFAVAARLAAEAPGLANELLLICADDSCVVGPLAELLPQLDPRTALMATRLIGNRSALSNSRARAVLGWRPTRTWR